MCDVLVVDDDPGTRDLLTTILSMCDMPHRAAHDGAMALNLIAAERPAVMLLDANMPILGGVEVCRALEAQGRRNEVVVVAMSATAEVRRFARECQADEVLPKPFDLDAVFNLFDRYRAATA